MEDIIYCNPIKVKDKLASFNFHDIILALMSASPKVNAYLQSIRLDIDMKEEQKKLGRVKIEDLEEAQIKLILHINQYSGGSDVTEYRNHEDTHP